ALRSAGFRHDREVPGREAYTAEDHCPGRRLHEEERSGEPGRDLL
ncbi:hypothetical protein AVDCRST_MAG82-132, partial [uncultured Rubrobacteraceae bacterium]